MVISRKIAETTGTVWQVPSLCIKYKGHRQVFSKETELNIAPISGKEKVQNNMVWPHVQPLRDKHTKEEETLVGYTVQIISV